MIFGANLFEFDICLNFGLRVGYSCKNNTLAIMFEESLKFAERRFCGQEEHSSSSNITQFSKFLDVFPIVLFQVIFFKYFFLMEDPFINIFLFGLPFIPTFFEDLSAWEVYHDSIVYYLAQIMYQDAVRSYDLGVMFITFFIFLLFSLD